jgi:hypothetical protein
MQAQRTEFGAIKVVLEDGEHLGHYDGPETLFVPDDPANVEAVELAKLVADGELDIRPHMPFKLD